MSRKQKWISIQELLLNRRIDVEKLKILIQTREIPCRIEESEGKTIYFVENSKKLLRISDGSINRMIPRSVYKVIENFSIATTAGVTAAYLSNKMEPRRSLVEKYDNDLSFQSVLPIYIQSTLDQELINSIWDVWCHKPLFYVYPGHRMRLDIVIMAICLIKTKKAMPCTLTLSQTINDVLGKHAIYYAYVEHIIRVGNSKVIWSQFSHADGEELFAMNLFDIEDLFVEMVEFAHDSISFPFSENSKQDMIISVAGQICKSMFIDSVIFWDNYGDYFPDAYCTNRLGC